MESLYYIKKTDGKYDYFSPRKLYEQVTFEINYHRPLSVKVSEILRIISTSDFPSELAEFLKSFMLKYFAKVFEKKKAGNFDAEDLTAVFDCYNSTNVAELREPLLHSFLQSLHESDKYQEWDKIKFQEFKDKKLFYPEIETLLRKDIANYKLNLISKRKAT